MNELLHCERKREHFSSKLNISPIRKLPNNVFWGKKTGSLQVVESCLKVKDLSGSNLLDNFSGDVL